MIFFRVWRNDFIAENAKNAENKFCFFLGGLALGVAPQLIVVGISETRFLEETWFLETLSTLKCSATALGGAR